MTVTRCDGRDITGVRRDVLHTEPNKRIDEVAQLAIALLDERLVLQALQTDFDDRDGAVIDQGREVAAERVAYTGLIELDGFQCGFVAFGQQFVEHIQERPAGGLLF